MICTQYMRPLGDSGGEYNDVWTDESYKRWMDLKFQETSHSLLRNRLFLIRHLYTPNHGRSSNVR